MVVFICNACGNSIKKAQVEKHWQFQCRRASCFSCIDCGKDFPGESYKSHNQCMTEQEKWHGNDFKPKTNGNTGRDKQDAWTESIHQAISSSNAKNPQLTSILEKLLSYENVPRKEAKFKNFLKNCLKIHNGQLVSAAWDVISSGMKNANNAAASGNAPVSEPIAKNGNSVKDEVEKDLKNLEASEEILSTAETEEQKTESKKKWKWKRAITSALSHAESFSLSKKKLKKKVLADYVSQTEDEIPQEVLNEKFEKYLTRYNSLFRIDDKIVHLINS